MKSLLAFGAILAALMQLMSYLWTKKKFAKFEVVKGVITQCEFSDFNDADGTRVYEANIEYKFSHQDQEITSSNVALRSFQLFPLHNFEVDLVGKYEVGQEVDVKLNPNNPANSFLEVAPLSLMSTVALVAAAGLGAAYLITFKVMMAGSNH